MPVLVERKFSRKLYHRSGKKEYADITHLFHREMRVSHTQINMNSIVSYLFESDIAGDSHIAGMQIWRDAKEEHSLQESRIVNLLGIQTYYLLP